MSTAVARVRVTAWLAVTCVGLLAAAAPAHGAGDLERAYATLAGKEFVDLTQIDPIYYDHSYYIAPTAGGAKAYRLLLEAMRESGKVALGRFVLRSKQQLCALRPLGSATVRAVCRSAARSVSAA